MKKIFCVILGLVLLSPFTAMAASKILIKQTDLDLPGPIYSGQKAQGVFEVLNEGDKDLEIKKVVPG